MRHRNSGRKLGRTSSHRKAMFSNMCCSLIEHELIRTTLPKAKDLRRYIEPLITVSKVDSVATRRHVFDTLRSKVLWVNCSQPWGLVMLSVQAVMCAYLNAVSALVIMRQWQSLNWSTGLLLKPKHNLVSVLKKPGIPGFFLSEK